jgi:hypothetical protein
MLPFFTKKINVQAGIFYRKITRFFFIKVLKYALNMSSDSFEDR